MHDACLVGAITHLAGLRILHGTSHIRRHRSDFRIRHQTTRPENLTQLTDDAHGIGACDHDVEIDFARLDLLCQVFKADDVRACRLEPASGFLPEVNTATRTALPIPCGNTVEPRTCWSDFEASMPRFTATSMDSRNFAVANSFTRAIAVSIGYCLLGAIFSALCLHIA